MLVFLAHCCTEKWLVLLKCSLLLLLTALHAEAVLRADKGIRLPRLRLPLRAALSALRVALPWWRLRTCASWRRLPLATARPLLVLRAASAWSTEPLTSWLVRLALTAPIRRHIQPHRCRFPLFLLLPFSVRLPLSSLSLLRLFAVPCLLLPQSLLLSAHSLLVPKAAHRLVKPVEAAAVLRREPLPLVDAAARPVKHHAAAVDLPAACLQGNGYSCTA